MRNLIWPSSAHLGLGLGFVPFDCKRVTGCPKPKPEKAATGIMILNAKASLIPGSNPGFRHAAAQASVIT